MTSFSAAGKTGSGHSRGHRRRDWLALAASPTFALMAWVTAGDTAALCAPGAGLLPIGGMATMYLLMSLFHLSPWLRLGTGSRGANDTPITKGDR